MKRNSKWIVALFVFILIVFFEPQMFKEDSFAGVEKIDFVYKIVKLLCFSITSIIYIIDNNYRISKLLFAIILLQMTMAISTILYNGDFVRFAGPAITTITMCMIGEILIRRKILFSVLKNVNSYFIICFIINLISIILIDFTSFKSITTVYFMGIDNRFVFTLIPWVLFEGLVSLHDNNIINTRWKVVFVLSELVLIYKFSVSAMIALLLYTFMLLFKNKNIKMKTNLFIFYLFSNISIIFLKIQKLFLGILKLLKKDATFSGRTFIWDGILKNFSKYPIIGHGMQSIKYDKNFFYFSSSPFYHKWCRVAHGHNSLMTILYRGGLVSAFIYLGIIYVSIYQLYKNYKNKYSRILLITLIIILLLSIFDTMDFAGLYFIIALIININMLDKTRKVKGNE